MCYGYECNFYIIDEFGNENCLNEENCKNYLIKRKKKSIEFGLIDCLDEK